MPELSEYSPEDIERVQALLKLPEGEKELEKWVKDWVNAHLYMTDASQLIGGVGFQFFQAEDLPEDTTSSTTFVSLGGPSLTGLAAGKWQFWWGYQARHAGGVDTNAEAGLSTSWAGLSDSNVASTRVLVGSSAKTAGFGRGYNNVDGPAPSGPNNSVEVHYRTQIGGTTIGFSKRWVCGVRVAEL